MPPFFNDFKCTFINTTKSFTAIQRSIFINLCYSQQFHFKYQGGKSRDRATGPCPVSHGVRDIDNPLIAYMHPLKSELPPINDIAQAESLGTTSLIGIVKLLAINQSPFVMYSNNTADSRRGLTLSCLQYLIIYTTRKGVYPLLGG